MNYDNPYGDPSYPSDYHQGSYSPGSHRNGNGNGSGGQGGQGSKRKRKESVASGGDGSEEEGKPKVPKRGSRACTNCRRGKNRCIGEQPCQRCTQHRLECVFEKPPVKHSSGGDGIPPDVEGRIAVIENSVSGLANSQGQMQSTLTQILAALSNQHAPQQPPMPSVPPPRSSSSINDLLTGPNPFSNISALPSPYSSREHGMDLDMGLNHTPSGSSLSHLQTTLDLAAAAVAGGGGSANGISPNFHSPSSWGHPTPQPQQPTPLNQFSASRAPSYHHQPSPPSAPYPVQQSPFHPPAPPARKFPKLPGFAPPPHRYAQYGLVIPSTAASSEDEAEDTLPRRAMDTPIEALQALANAADQAAQEEKRGGGSAMASVWEGEPKVMQGRVGMKKRKMPEPTPRNAFPDVLTKGLVTETEARELWKIFFSGCNMFVPMFDPSYDVFETFIARTPFSFDGMLAVAAKIRAGNSAPGPTYHKCLEEAQGIARSTLFGPCVRTEAVMAVHILASWSQHGWLPSGHALRMGLDISLHKALDKLADGSGTLGGKTRNDGEERDLVIAARVWMNVYLSDHIICLGTGRPLLLRDDSSVKHARLLLTHPMGTETDFRLISLIELVAYKVRVYDTLHPLKGVIDKSSIGFIHRALTDLLVWHQEWRTLHLRKHAEDDPLVKLLDAELYYAQLWTACVALRGCSWDRLSFEQRELAFQAKEAALHCLATYQSPTLRRYLKYAVHETMVQISFSSIFLLKVAILFPTDLPAPMISAQVSELAQLLSVECAAERYALTLRLMLRSFRRKMGEVSQIPGTPRNNGTSSNAPPGSGGQVMQNGGGQQLMGHAGNSGLQSLLSVNHHQSNDYSFLDDLGGSFVWPEFGFSPSSLPAWINETNMMDLGLPWDGSDSVIMPPELANMFLPAAPEHAYQFGDSADVGAEAW